MFASRYGFGVHDGPFGFSTDEAADVVDFCLGRVVKAYGYFFVGGVVAGFYVVLPCKFQGVSCFDGSCIGSRFDVEACVQCGDAQFVLPAGDVSACDVPCVFVCFVRHVCREFGDVCGVAFDGGVVIDGVVQVRRVDFVFHVPACDFGFNNVSIAYKCHGLASGLVRFYGLGRVGSISDLEFGFRVGDGCGGIVDVGDDVTGHLACQFGFVDAIGDFSSRKAYGHGVINGGKFYGRRGRSSQGHVFCRGTRFEVEARFEVLDGGAVVDGVVDVGLEFCLVDAYVESACVDGGLDVGVSCNGNGASCFDGLGSCCCVFQGPALS